VSSAEVDDDEDDIVEQLERYFDQFSTDLERSQGTNWNVFWTHEYSSKTCV
jgi:hypothetical protein